MRRRLLVPRRRAWLGFVAVLAAGASSVGAGSCGAGGSASVTATGTTLTIYTSAPTGDVLDAERLALNGSSTVGKFRLRLVPVGHAKISDDARAAIEDTSSIAYLGELAPGASEQSVGITNGLDLLQVSPTDTALELTQVSAAVPGAPGRYYQARSSYGQTFARVVPNSAQEAKAQVQEMQALHVQKLYIANDGTPYAAAVALAVREAAAAASLSAVQGTPTAAGFAASGADAFFYGGSSAGASSAAKLLGTVAATHNGVKLFVPSALDSDAFAAAFAGAKVQLYASSPGVQTKQLPPAGQQFVSSFTSAYGHAPAPAALFGFEAMKAVLSALQNAGSSASDRSKVVKQFFAIRNRPSVVGTYSINASGDTTLTQFVFSRLRGGRLVPFASSAG